MSSPFVLSNPQINFSLPSNGSAWLSILVPAFLFGVLAPGGFLSIPPAKSGPNKGEILTFRSARWGTIIVHTLVFALLWWLLRAIFPFLKG